jgi:hypothetical protein
LTITAAAAGVLLMLLSVFGTRLSQFFLITESKSTVQTEARNAIAQIVTRLKNGSAASMTIDSLPGQPPFSRITIPMAVGGAVVIFRQEGVNLVREENGNATVLTTHLKSLVFTRPIAQDPSYVGVSVSLQKTYGRDNRASYEAVSDYIKIYNP